MSNITLNPANGPVSVNVAVNSMQVVGMSITVYAPDGATPLEHYLSDSQTNNPYNVVLKNPPANYSGCYVCGTFTIVDPVGAGNTFAIIFSIQQQGVAINPTIPINGTSTQGQVLRVANFQIQ